MHFLIILKYSSCFLGKSTVLGNLWTGCKEVRMRSTIDLEYPQTETDWRMRMMTWGLDKVSRLNTIFFINGHPRSGGGLHVYTTHFIAVQQVLLWGSGRPRTVLSTEDAGIILAAVS